MESFNFLQTSMEYLGREFWLIQLFAVVFFTVLLNFFQKRVLNKLMLKFEQTTFYWDDALIKAVRPPLTLLIWILGLSFAAEIVRDESKTGIFGTIGPIREVGVIVVLAWFLVRFIQQVGGNIIQARQRLDKPYDRTTVDAIVKLLKVSVYITSFLIVLQSLGYSISGVLAFGGIGGIAIGFAARDLLANFFGGLMIYLDRPFKVGDWVRSPDREIEGTVEYIGWRLTRIRTFDQRPLYVPNAIFTNIAVENPSRMTNRRINETIGIRYEDSNKMAAIVAAVRQMLEKHEEIDATQTLIVNFDVYAPSSLNFFIYTFTKTTDWIRFHEIKQDVLLKILEIIEVQGAECAFPTSTLHIAHAGDTVEGKQN